MNLREYCHLSDIRNQDKDWDPLSARGSTPFLSAGENIIWPKGQNYN